MKLATVINNSQELELMVQKVKVAQQEYSTFTQEQVDRIFAGAAIAADAARIELALEAAAETGMGVAEDKIIKNHFAAEYIYNKYRHEKTCGVIEEDVSGGIKKIAEPLGIIAGIIPTTNPTSTTIFKCLIALKTRNAIIFSPHPRAKNCTVHTAKLMLEAAVKAGAPDNIIAWIDEPSVEMSKQLMKHPSISLILATGGEAMVRAAYSSGNPAIGVGPGNTPVVIDETVDVKMVVSSILMSKIFDNGVICASEQSCVVVKDVYDEIKKEFKERGGYYLSREEKEKVGAKLFIDGKLNLEVVGQPAIKIAKMAGIDVPVNTKVLIAEAEKIGPSEPFSGEKLSPTLAVYRANDYHDAISIACDLLRYGGMGHTAVLYTDPSNRDRVTYFGSKLNAGRLLLNIPASQGAIGDIFNFKLEPSLTLGCGSWGGNAVSENIGVKHLLNKKTIAERRENTLWFKAPPKIYFKFGCTELSLNELGDKKRAFIVTDKVLYDLNYTKKVTAILDKKGIAYSIFYDIEPNPTLGSVKKGLSIINSFQPDVIIALGGGSPIDAAKIIWLFYEHPEVKFEDMSLRFMDIQKRICTFPTLGTKATMVAIPTTSGTGSEVTPFAVITDESTGAKYPIADYVLTPHMAIIDPEFVLTMPKGLVAFSGLDALTHALEAYVSICSTEYTKPLALEAMRLIFKYLPASYKTASLLAREKVHYASTIAGLSFANAFLGICHSMAHKLGAEFDLPHGLANALMISQVIKYNASEVPTRQAIFSQYKYPWGRDRYAYISDFLGLGGNNLDEKVNKLLQAIDQLKKDLNCPMSIQQAGVNEKDFYQRLDQMSVNAFDDQCTGANPRYPLISEIKELYIKAFKGEV